MSKINIEVGDKTLEFEVTNQDFNRYINEQMPNDKIAPAFNLLSRTVVEKDKDEFQKVATIDGSANGLVVMQMAGLVAEIFGGSVSVTLKKPKASQSA